MIPLPYTQLDAYTGMLLDHVNDLKAVANTFINAPTNRFKLLTAYRERVNTICSACSRHPEHEGMVGLLCILMDGIDVLLDDISVFSTFHQVFLAKIPEYINEHLNFPDSKMPCSFMLRHLSSKMWVRPLSIDEQQFYIERIMRNFDERSAEAVIPSLEILIDDVPVLTDDNTTDEISIDDFFSVESDSSDVEPKLIFLDNSVD